MYTFIMGSRDSSGNVRFSSSDFNFTSPLASSTGETVVGSSSSGGGSSSSRQPTGAEIIAGQSFADSPLVPTPSKEEDRSVQRRITPAGTPTTTSSGGTLQGGITPSESKQFNIHSPGTTYQYQTGSFESKGKIIPTFKTFTIEENYSSREATVEESKKLRGYVQSKDYETTALAPTPSLIKRTYRETKGRAEEFGSKPFYDVGKVEEFSSQFGTNGNLLGKKRGCGGGDRRWCKCPYWGLQK